MEQYRKKCGLFEQIDGPSAQGSVADAIEPEPFLNQVLLAGVFSSEATLLPAHLS